MLEPSSSLEIKQFVETINVPYLVHFTQVPNLPSILEHGIYPVIRHDELPNSPLVNDFLRLDGRRDANCISIAFPNYRMFYKYRSLFQQAEWAVVQLDRSILWNKRCAFCRHNAASDKIRQARLGDLTTPRAFKEMFEELENHPSRSGQRLWSYDPTDVQAEVLVFDIIEPSLIREISFQTYKVKSRHRSLVDAKSQVKLGVSDMFFSERSIVRDRS